MIDLSDADPLTADLLLTLNQYQVPIAYKLEALRAAARTIDAMAALEAEMDSRGRWQVTDSGLVHVGGRVGD